jgi:hypothetical protein
VLVEVDPARVRRDLDELVQEAGQLTSTCREATRSRQGETGLSFSSRRVNCHAENSNTGIKRIRRTRTVRLSAVSGLRRSVSSCADGRHPLPSLAAASPASAV